MPARQVYLSDADRRELERVVGRDPRPYMRERAAAILKVADGASVSAVAAGGLPRTRTRETVGDWISRYEADGVDGLVQLPRGHRGFSPRLASLVAAVTMDAPAVYGLDRARWRLADLRQVLPPLANYSISGLSRALRRFGLAGNAGGGGCAAPIPPTGRRRRRSRRRSMTPAPIPSASPSTTATRSVAIGSRRSPRFGDWPGSSRPRRARTAPTPAIGSAAPSTPSSGRLVATTGAQVTVPHLCRFLRVLRAADPDRAITVVWDNWPVHAHPRVLAAAAAVAITILWLPTYAPWLNPIEKLWRQLKQEVLHHHRFADDWDGLKAAVQRFLDRCASPSCARLHSVGLLSD